MPSLAIKLRAITLAMLACIVLTHSALAAVYYVRKTGSDANNGITPDKAFLTINKAMSMVAGGDTVYIGAGTYNEQVTCATSGWNGGTITIIGDINGFATGDAGTVTISHATLPLTVNRDYHTYQDIVISGGSSAGLAITGGTNILFKRCTITQSSAVFGVNITGGSVITFEDCEISEHLTSTGVGGCGMDVTSASANVTIRDCLFRNMANDGFRISAAGPTATLERSIFRNCADAGIQVRSGTTTIVNCLSYDNNRGLNIESTGLTNPTITVRGSTLANNTAQGIQLQCGTINLFGTIVFGNGTWGLQMNGSSATIGANVSNLFNSNTSGNVTGISLTPSLTSNPNFVDWGARDYRLTSSSPARNQVAAASMGSTTEDILGVCRTISGSTYCIGAYEFVNATAQSIPYTNSFESAASGGVGSNYPGWTTGTRETNAGTTFILGRFGGALATTARIGHTLALTTTPGTTYEVQFDLLIFDTWDTENFEVMVNGSQAWLSTHAGATTGNALSTSILSAPETNTTNLAGMSNYADAIYRQVAFTFRATSATSYLTFRSNLDTASTDESWAIDNIAVTTFSYPTTPYAWTFSTSAYAGPEWFTPRTTSYGSVIGLVAGNFGLRSNSQDFQALLVSSTPGTTYYLVFDLVISQSWDGDGTGCCGPDSMNVYVDGTNRWSYYFSLSYPFNWGNQNYPANPDDNSDGTMPTNGAWTEWVYRRVFIPFTATQSTTVVAWQGLCNEDYTNESWAIQNVAVCPAGNANIFSYMPRFQDVTLALGFDATIEWNNNASGGIHPGDFNKDGFTDFIINGQTRSILALWNRNTSKYDITTFGSGTVQYQGAMLDYDADGNLDFFGFDNTGTSTFYQNNGSGSFTNRGSLSLSGPTNRVGCAAIDANADGRTDIVIFDNASGGKNYAAINTAPGTGATQPTFPTNITTFPQTASDTGAALYMSSADINNDGYPDFWYQVNSGRIYRSALSGGTLSWAGSSPFASSVNMYNGSAWGDYNNSGWVSLFLPSRVAGTIPELWKNPGASGSWSNVNASAAIGIDMRNRVQTSACWGDYDNDGFLDLFIACNQGSVLYRNNGNGTFTRVFEGIGAMTGMSCDAKFVDIDNDGDLDLVVTSGDNGNNSSVRPRLRIFKNLTVELTDQKNFLEVRPVITSGGVTRTDVRARVELWLNGSFVARRDTGNASGYGGEESFIAHFGGINPASNYTVRVYTNGKLYETTCTPNATSTTIGNTTIQQMLTVNCASSVVITQWVESAP